MAPVAEQQGRRDGSSGRWPSEGVDAAALEQPPVAAVDFTDVYRDHIAYLWRVLRRLGVAERYLPDVVHDAFIVVHRRLDSYDPERPLRPWLTGIAYRVASEHRRRAVVRRELLDGDRPAEAASGQTSVDDQLIARERCRVLRAALDQLDDKKRDVFVLHEIEGYTMPQIADIVGAPLNTLYSRLRLARRELRAAVDQIGDGGMT